MDGIIAYTLSKQYIKRQIAEKSTDDVDLSSYALKTEVNAAIQTAIGNIEAQLSQV